MLATISVVAIFWFAICIETYQENAYCLVGFDFQVVCFSFYYFKILQNAWIEEVMKVE